MRQICTKQIDLSNKQNRSWIFLNASFTTINYNVENYDEVCVVAYFNNSPEDAASILVPKPVIKRNNFTDFEVMGKNTGLFAEIRFTTTSITIISATASTSIYAWAR